MPLSVPHSAGVTACERAHSAFDVGAGPQAHAQALLPSGSSRQVVERAQVGSAEPALCPLQVHAMMKQMPTGTRAVSNCTA